MHALAASRPRRSPPSADQRTGWILSAIFIALLLATLLAAGARAADAPGAAGALVGRILGPTPTMSDLRELTDAVGGRISGGPACDRAIAWAEKKFREIPADVVELEPFTIPNAWLPRRAEASCLGPAPFPLRIAAAPGTAGTPAGPPIEAAVVDAGDGSVESFAKLGSTAKGAIAIVHNPVMTSFDDLFAEYLKSPELIAGARSASVAAVLLQSSRPRGLLYRHPVTFDGSVAPVPVALIAREQADRLLRLAEKGPVRARVAIDNEIVPNAPSRNVIATIAGSDKKSEIVLVGAHLDAWDLGTGANDNGVSCAQIIDLARQIKKLGLTPRRTIVFALFTGEEQGMFGSRAYVDRHAARLRDHVAVVIHDTGSGRLAGYYLQGRADSRAALDGALAPVASLGPFENPIDALDGTDDFDFLLSGIPTLVGAQDPVPYLPDYHAESDTFDKVDPRETKLAEAVLAALVWDLANRDGRIAPRLTRPEIDKLITATKLDVQMKAFAQWDDWVAGKRGHPPGGTP
jgi:carboxypeptidase Q